MTDTLKISVVSHADLPLPKHETMQAAGVDLRANLSEAVVLNPMERKLIGTGLHMELPDGYEAQIRPRSGLAYKQGLTVLNSPGTIDADYRGEIKVLLVNLSNEEATINHGDRIAQMIVAPYQRIELSKTDKLSDTHRGSGGYGSTGKG